MPILDRNCAAAKVLYYARLYSGRQLAENANYANIVNGWTTSINRMVNLMTSCNKCGTVECENLAKQVAHAWLKAFNIPEVGATAEPKGCSTPATSMDAAYKVAYYIDYYGGVNLKGNPAFSVLFSGPNNSELLGIINGYKTSIATIRGGLKCTDHRTCATVTCENTAKLVAQAWLKAHQYQASGGTKGGGAQAPKPTGTDSDCYHWGGDFLGGALDGLCVGAKKLTKGAEGAAQDPINRWFPLILLGFGAIAMLMLFKR